MAKRLYMIVMVSYPEEIGAIIELDSKDVSAISGVYYGEGYFEFKYYPLKKTASSYVDGRVRHFRYPMKVKPTTKKTLYTMLKEQAKELANGS